MTDLEYIFKAYNEATEGTKNLLGHTLIGVVKAEMEERTDTLKKKVLPIGEYRDSKLSDWGFQYKDYECKNKDCNKYNEL